MDRWYELKDKARVSDDPSVLFCIPSWIMMSLAKIPETSVIDSTPWFKKTSIINVPLFRYQRMSSNTVNRLLTEVNLLISFLCLL